MILRIFDVGRFGGSYVFANSGSFLKTMELGMMYAESILKDMMAHLNATLFASSILEVQRPGFRGGFNYILYFFTMFLYLSPLFKGNIVYKCHLFFQRDFSPPSHASFLGKVTRKHTTCEIWFQLVLSANKTLCKDG